MSKKNITTCLLIAAAYALSGKAALLLALPPGYASPIFPPAGIAVAVAFIMGWRVLPGVFTGSLLLNIWTGYAATHQLDAGSLAAAAIIAAASMLQGAAGGWALRRAVGYPAALDNSQDITRFLLLTPAICLISASLSVGGLYLLGIFAADSLAANWFSWWAGDALGVMLVLPLAMTLVGEPRALWRKRMKAVALPMLLIFAFFVAMYLKINQWEHEESLKEFNHVSIQSLDNLGSHLEEQETLLLSIRGHFMYDNEVTRQEFQHFTHDMLPRFPMIQALEWAPRIDALQRNTFEAAQRRQVAGFEIRERDAEDKLQRAGNRPQFYPVTYTEPAGGNQQAIGFDLGSNSKRLETIEKSFTTGKAIATAPIRLVQANNQAGLLFVQATKINGHNSGVVISALKLHDFVEKSLPPAAAILQLRLVDKDAQQVIYDNFATAQHAALFEHDFEFGSRHYLLQTAPTAAYLRQHRGWQSWGVLAMGTLGTGLLGALFLLGTGYTARMEAQVEDRTREFRDSELRLNEAQRIAKLGSWTLDLRSNQLEWSDEIYRIFEIDPRKFGASYEAFLNAIHPEDREAVNRAYTDSIARRLPYEITHRLLFADGRVKYVTERCETLHAEDGSPMLSSGTVQDVTIRHLAELELRRQERETQAILDNATVAIIATTPQGRITRFNRTAEEMLGYRAEEMVGRQTPAAFHDPEEIAASARQLGEELGMELAPGFEVFVEKSRRSLPNQHEWTYIRKDGSRFPVLLSVAAIRDENGESTGYLGVAQDITERKQHEKTIRENAEHMQAIFDNVVDGIITIDEHGTVVSFNKAAESIFGYRADEVVGNNVNMLMPNPYHDAHDGYLSNYLTTHVPRIIGTGREVIGLRRNGGTFPMDLAVSEITHRGQRMFIGIVRDITERKRVERMKNEFVATVSHELRTPLTSISGALGLMAGGALGSLPEQVQAMIGIAHKNSIQLGHLINDLLDMEKIAAGKMDFDMQLQPLMPLVEQALDTTRGYGEQYRVRYVLTERGDNIMVTVDAHRLVQILSNFLSNAAKFSPEGSEVEIAVRRTADSVRVAVRDHGPGIPAEFRNHIFQKFSQADSSDTRAQGGTGLGLAITKELAERMSGSVGFESEEGKGSVFYVELPLPEPAREGRA